MNLNNKFIGKEYKEEYKRKRESRLINKDPEVKKKFGVFKVLELLKYEDKQHFKSLYNYDSKILDEYMLPEEKKEKAEQLLKHKERECKNKKLSPLNEKNKRISNISKSKIFDVNNNNKENLSMKLDSIQEEVHYDNKIPEELANSIKSNYEDKNTLKFKEVLLNILNPYKKNEEEEQEELFDNKDSKIGKEIAQMKTGEEAVQFFAMYGDTTPIKFIFCKKKELEEGQFSPYELTITKDIKKLPEYFVVTPTGITRVYTPGIKDVSKFSRKDFNKSVGEFFSLSDWMQQSTLFNILIKINYFVNFLRFKIFIIWRNYNRFKRFLRIRSGLGNKLFLSKPAFLNELIEVNSQICQIENVSLQDITHKLWTFNNLTDFVEHQKKTLENGKNVINNKITVELSELMKGVYFSVTRRLKNNKEIEEIENNKTLQELRNKSMYHLKLEKAQRKKLIFRATQDSFSYDRFSNLVDLMIIELLYQLYKKDLESIYNQLTQVKHDSSYAGIFTLSLNFNGSLAQLTPNDEDLTNHFKNLFKGITETITDIPRIKLTYNKKNLDSFNEEDDKKTNYISEHGSLNTNDKMKHMFKDILESSSYYKLNTENILSFLVKEYKKSKKIIEEKMVQFKDIQLMKETEKIEDFIKTKPNTEQIEKKMDQINVYTNKIENKIIASYNSKDSIMNIDSLAVKDDLKKYLDYCKEQLETYIIDVFKELSSLIDITLKKCDYIKKLKTDNVKYAYDAKISLREFDTDIKKLELLIKNVKNTRDLITDLKLNITRGKSIGSEYDDHDVRMTKYSNLIKDSDDIKAKINSKKEEFLRDIELVIEENNKNVEVLLNKLNDTTTILYDENANREDVISELSNIKNKILDIRKSYETFNEYDAVLNENQVIKPLYELKQLEKKHEVRNTLWTMLNSITNDKRNWNNMSLNEIKKNNIEKKILEYNTVRINISSDINSREDYEDKVYIEYCKEVEDCQKIAPIIISLSQPSLMDVHWDQIFKLFNMRYDPNRSLDEKQFSDFSDAIEKEFIKLQIDKIAVESVAQGEIRANLDTVIKDWNECEFEVKQHNSKDKFIICSIEKAMSNIEVHSQLIQSAMNSIYIGHLKSEAQQWDDSLNLINRVIEEWLFVQKQWIYLENIFSADDIKKQIPDAYQIFSKVNKSFIDLMQKTNDKPNVLERCKQPQLLENLTRYNKELDSIKKKLEDYLQTKRASFPRFYFLSEEELLKILSQTRNPRAVQDYLIKCFDGIKTIRFASDKSNEIISIVSPEGEDVELNEQIVAHENINQWLCDLERIVFSTCYDEVKKALEGHPENGINRKEWILESDYICQAVITVDQIKWAESIENSLDCLSKNENSLKEYLITINSQLQELTELVMIKPIGENAHRMALGKSLLERLIIIDVHGRTVLRELIKEGVCDKNNFEWQKNLKFYWEDNVSPENGERMDVIIRQTNSKFIYGYEYLGNPERMVITPLTDICYITLTSAMNLNYGGAPAGPAGTGKTETTKDLGKALAVKVNVFNCSNQLDFRMMGKMFCGLAECGAWACFDEFNLIDVEVLSVIAQQISTIQMGLKEKKKNIIFDKRQINLKPRFSVFITMNPGYAGRSDLPDNLKSLFRPVAMMIPDYALVSQVTLMSKGFKEAESLSVKMYYLFQLSSEQLSKQKHYDFGLRGIKTILTRAGYLKEKYYNEEEKKILITAMKDSNLPKFLDQDISLFLDIINDLFPNTNVKKEDNIILNNKIKETLLNNSLIYEYIEHNKKDITQTKIIEKINQLLDTLQVRCGNMIIGLTGTGKSTVYNTLQKSLSDLGKAAEKPESEIPLDPWYCPISLKILNPKSVGKNDLYMNKDEMTQTWEDGIVAKIMREAEEEEKRLEQSSDDNKNKNPRKMPNREWVVFDGPVDALWIEDMNTVLDDSRKLCLPDSSNIRIPKLMNLIFEVNDLKVASPATVSRCGIVFVEQHHVGYIPLIISWHIQIKKKLHSKFEENGSEKAFPNEVKNYLSYIDIVFKILMEFVPQILTFLRSECKEKIKSSDVNLVKSCLNILSSFFNTEYISLKTKDLEVAFKSYTIFSIIWSFGANIEDLSRPKISKFIKNIAGEIGMIINSNDVFEISVDKNTFLFTKWHPGISFKYDTKSSFFDILVPTEDTVKYKFLMQVFKDNNLNSLFIGETGVGKSVMAMDFLNNLSNNESNSYITKSSNFSAKTTSKNIYDLFKATIYKNGNFYPPFGKKFVYLVDDINLPQLDKFGSQQPIEFIRQLIDSKMFYDEKRQLRHIKDTIFMACCAPPSGARNPVTPRLFRHFNMIWIPDLKEDSMKTIFKEILKGYLETGPLIGNKESLDLIEKLDVIMNCSLSIYNKIRMEKLPTPEKSHYTFNLRDMSKIVQGMLQMPIEKMTSENILYKLWVHETSRQFRDRLLKNDIEWFDNNMYLLMNEHLSLDKESVDIDKLIFTSVIDKGSNNYKMVEDNKVLNTRIKEALEKNNMTNKNQQMDLVFFNDAINHFCRIARIVSQQRGNALLVGMGGSGRQSLTKLVASCLDYNIRGLSIGKGYNTESFKNDMEEVLEKAGVNESNKPTVFLFSDSQILKESFLEDINNVLNNGEIPNLFKDETLNRIHNSLKATARLEGKGESKDAVYQFFVKRVRDNFRIVLSFSPVGAEFRNRCKQFPSIINCCTIDWFNPWPDSALSSVAEKKLLENDSFANDESKLKKLKNIFVNIHNKAKAISSKIKDELRKNYYITPTSYLEFLKLFLSIYDEKQLIIPKQIANYNLGIKKLNQANDIVEDLKENLKELEPIQIEKKTEVESMIENLEKSKETVRVEEAKLKVDKDKVEAHKEKIEQEKHICDEELAKALPALNNAEAALRSLKDDDIKLLGSFPNPSEKILNLAKCISCIFDTKKNEYSDFKGVISNAKGFISTCVNTEVMIQKLNNSRKLKNVQELYNVIADIDYKSVAFAAVGLKIWIGAIIEYVYSYKETKPKMEKVEVMQGELDKVISEYNEKNKFLFEKQEELRVLEKQYNDKNSELQELSNSIDNIKLKSSRAGRLVEGLLHEEKTWKKNINILTTEEKNLLANVVLASSGIGYTGPMSLEYRLEFIDSVKSYIKDNGINLNEKTQLFSIKNVLGDSMVIRDWNYAGLPADDLSIENAIITTRARKWPLIIDPQMQANKWIKNYYKTIMNSSNNVNNLANSQTLGIKIFKLSTKNLINKIKDCVISGIPVLVENVEEKIDNSLEPILNKNLYKQGNYYFMTMGGTEKPIIYNDNFKFFMTTKLPNPHYYPEISIKVTVINFTVTLKGLEDQLLVDVVKNERPELEETKDNLILNINKSKNSIKESEAKILNMVKDAGDDILDTDTLILNLEKSKLQGQTIEKELAEAEQTSEKINKERKLYKSIAVRGSIIYFVIASLINIDSMYNYSLEFFTKLFNQRLSKSEKSNNVLKRVEILINDITLSFYEKICRGLFTKDQTLYSFLILINILLEKGDEVRQSEWNVFLRGFNSNSNAEKSEVDFLSLENYRSLINLNNNLSAFNGIKDSVLNSPKEWKEYFESNNIFNSILPGNFEEKLSDFNKLLLIKYIREESLIFSIKLFIEKKFKNPRFIQAPPFNIHNAFEDSNKYTPLIFILSPGANPVSFLDQYAKERNINLKILSLGQGQDKEARECINGARIKGDWLCLENCHLYLSWMPTLEEIQEELNDGIEVHKNYRLWLTSKPDSQFPSSILQSGVKITNEPPKGLKANLTGTFNNIKEEELFNSKKPSEFKTLLYSLAFFHAVILERKKFGPLGWNISYDWMNSDFEASKLHLIKYLDEYEKVPLKTLRYLIGCINYGGRVTDDKDSKLINAILDKYLDETVFQSYFSFSEDGLYKIPKYDSLQGLTNYIEKLPSDDGPSVFGLHNNANIMLQKKLVREFMDPLIAIQPKTSSNSSKKPNDIVLEIKASIDNKLSSLDEIEISKANKDSIYNPITNKKTSLGNFLLQEVDKFNLLLKTMKDYLKNLELAVLGKQVMSLELEEIFYCFLDNKFPKQWEDVSYLTLKPLGSWIENFVERFKFIRSWLYEGNLKAYWISAFFFPQGKNNYYTFNLNFI